MDYKKLIKSKKIRLKILELLKIVPDEIMVKLQYRVSMGKKVDLNDPKRFTEKLQYYKLFYRNPLLIVAADKFEVREFVKNKGLAVILNDLYGVYEKPEDIEYASLPNKFALKTTKGSGTNYFCKDKFNIDIKKLNYQVNEWLNQNPIPAGREWSYNGKDEKIIIEKFLDDDNNEFHDISDYKFMCFNGEVRYIVFDVDRHVNHKRNFYDADWNFIDVESDHPNIGDIVDKPLGLEKMKEVAKKLSEDFPFVRVDLYWINNKVIFGELTFYPWSGYVKFNPDSFDYKLGEHFNISSVKLS